MQNLGFAYAMIPLFRERKLPENDLEALLIRHLQMFNTHPYLSAPLIGSVVRMEEERQSGTDGSAVVAVKESLTGPYAAIGDTFFWGALRPCAGIISIFLAWMGWILAPLAFVLIYTPAHIWIRAKGFVEGYRRGKQGIEFVRRMELPRIASRIRWLSLVVLSGYGVWFLKDMHSAIVPTSLIVLAPAVLAVILLCRYMLKKGISQMYILCGTIILFLIISWREILVFWK